MRQLEEYIEFANSNPVCFMGTVDGGAPRVRGMLLWFADETGFYFYTGKSKDLCRQLVADPRIEVCFYRQGPTFVDTVMLRISGKAEFIDDGRLISNMREQRPYLRALSKSLRIFRISRGRAVRWSGADAVARPRAVPFRCGGSITRNRGAASSCLSFQSGGKYHHLNHEKIVFLSSHGKHTVIHACGGDYDVPVLFKEIGKNLPGTTFVRIHRQFIVNRNFIARVAHGSGGRFTLYLADEDDSALPVGRAYAKTLRLITGAGTFVP